jgi:hypothetical protein
MMRKEEIKPYIQMIGMNGYREKRRDKNNRTKEITKRLLD